MNLKGLVTGRTELLLVCVGKFHFGKPRSSGLVFELTTEWSLPKNSLVTMDVLREACELETRTKSNRLHALRPSSSERKMCRRSGIYDN